MMILVYLLLTPCASAKSPDEFESDVKSLLEANNLCEWKSTVEEGICLFEMRKAAEQELDSITDESFASITASLDQTLALIRPEEWKHAFVQANEAWIAYRNATCDLYWYETIPGSGTGNVVEQCKFDMTIDRIKYVRAYGISNSVKTAR